MESLEIWSKSIDDIILSYSYSPDGSKIIVCGEDILILFDSETGKEIWSKTDGGVIFQCSYYHDGSRIVTLSFDDILRCYSLTGEILWSKDNIYPNYVCSPDKRSIVVKSGGGFLICFDILTGEELWTYKCRDNTGLSYSPDSSRLICSSSRGFISCIDSKYGSRIWSIWLSSHKRHSYDYPRETIYLPDDSLIVLSFHAIKSVDTISGDMLWSVEHNNVEMCICSPDFSSIISCSKKFMKCWNSRNGEEMWSIDLTGLPKSLTYSPDGSYILLGCGDVLMILDSSTGDILWSMESVHITQSGYSPDGSNIFYSSVLDISVIVNPLNNWTPQTNKYYPENVKARIENLMLIREFGDSGLSSLPKELMYEICRHL